MRGLRPDLREGGFWAYVDRYPMTLGILAANLLLYVFAIRAQGGATIDPLVMAQLGGNFPPLAGAEPWRLLTSAFLHYSPIHFLFNSVALFIIGRILEVHFGSNRLFTLYVGFALAGGLGTVVRYAVTGYAPVSAGASGALFGLILLGFVYARSAPERLGSLADNLRVWIIYGVVISFLPRIDWAGHAGGALAGALAGLVVRPRPGAGVSVAWTVAAVTLALVCLGSFALALRGPDLAS